jgi:predicted AlkP superfamily phosphohydrolase/phosphomutase
VNINLAKILKSNVAKRLINQVNSGAASINNRIRYQKVLERILPDDVAEDPFTQDITNIPVDWQRTKAFGFGYYNQIYINTKERGGCVTHDEYWLLLHHIITDLKKLGEKSHLNIEVFFNDKKVSGILDSTPDIQYMINNGEYVQSNKFNPYNVWGEAKEKSGDHRLNGIWILYGKGVKKGYYQQLNIWDLAPIIYKLYNIKIPLDVDGKLPINIFEQNINGGKTND